MVAYVIFTRESTTNQEEMDVYAGLAGPTLQGHPATPRVFYGAFELLEGPPLEGTVVLEFPSMAEARAWYHSPAYQAAAVHRKAGSVYRAFIVEGVPGG
jgi:uncharacterized protein (DUF1330 family)